MARAGLSEVRFFYVPVQAREPQPALHAAGQELNVTLNWRPGREAASHKVYLSADPNAVANGTASAHTVSTHYLDLTALNLATTYYWRVDEVNDAASPGVWTGAAWSFSTREYLVVDDFESYNDEEGRGTRIYETWMDGWSDNSSGSQVGYADPPFAERTLVHGGRQSMPLTYDNTSATYSEATRTFDSPQHWTLHGIKGLTLRFCGAATNVAQQMYVKINSTKIPYDGDALHLKLAGWKMWYIDLTSSSVSKVAKRSIGFDRLGGVGGQGKVFIDDIRLYAYARQIARYHGPLPQRHAGGDCRPHTDVKESW